MKKTNAYIISDENDQVYLSTLRIKKLDCIKDFAKEMEMEWNVIRKKGWKCLKVTVAIHKDKKTTKS